VQAWPGLVALLVTIIGIITTHPGLESQRPAPETPEGSPSAPHTARARLWQDPLAAVWGTGFANRSPKPKENDAAPPVGSGADGLQPPHGETKVLFLLDCLYPEIGDELAEDRRRERYATLSALSTAGYVPEDSEHIQYATLAELRAGAAAPAPHPHAPLIETLARPAGLKPAAAAPAPQPPASDRQYWAIPYEWMVWSPEKPRDRNCYEAVCVLWVPQTDDLGFLCSLKSALARTLRRDSPKFAVKGMIDSTELTTLKAGDNDCGSGNMPLYARSTHLITQALGAQAFAPAGAPLGSIAQVIVASKVSALDAFLPLYVTYATAQLTRAPAKNKTLQIEYLIETDDHLIDCMVDELNRRGITPGRDQTAIVAEWDTPYGREMVKYYRDAAKKRVDPDHQPHASSDWQDKHQIHHYSYMRGLDGKALRKVGDEPKGASQEPAAGNEESGGARARPAKPAAKEGQGEQQFDYLRRLAERMKADHPDLKAIGILGNDVYDKLLLLRALRPYFPATTFFTTDLDVRLLQPASYAETRNLLIAAPYGLSLHPHLQGGVPPFRSSYDTASYLATLRAVHYQPSDDGGGFLMRRRVSDDITDDSKRIALDQKIALDQDARLPVQIFEVSRSGAYPLTLNDPLGLPGPRRVFWLRPLNVLWLLVGAFAAALLFYPLSAWWQRLAYPALEPVFRLARSPVKRWLSAEQRERGSGESGWRRILLGIACVVFLGLFVLMCYAHAMEDQEPVVLFEGISSWPTIVLWAVAIVLSVVEVVLAWDRLSDSAKHIRQEIFRDPLPEGETPVPGAPGKSQADDPTPQASTDGWGSTQKEKTVRDLYDGLERDGEGRRRLVRCIGYLLIIAFAFISIWGLTGSKSFVLDSGARGWLARWTAWALRFVVFVTLIALIVFVLDWTLISLRFVRKLYRQESPVWPWLALKNAAEARKLPVPPAAGLPDSGDGVVIRTGLDYWLQLQLIDRVTGVVAGLIFSPFIVLLVLIVAQNRIFDDWHPDVVSVLVALFCVATTVGCAVLLQRAAKEAKRKALTKLDESLLPRVADRDDQLADKLRRIRDDIAGLNTGAFASWWSSPVVQAICLAAGGGGALAALDAVLPYFSR
jgi:hypothetical protein